MIDGKPRDPQMRVRVVLAGKLGWIGLGKTESNKGPEPSNTGYPSPGSEKSEDH